MTPLRELYVLYYYPNPAKEERRRQLLTEIPTDARDEDNYGRTSLLFLVYYLRGRWLKMRMYETSLSL